MSTIQPKEFTTKKGRKAQLRSAELADAASLIAYCKSILLPSESFVTQADEFDMTEDEQREWIRRHLDSPGGLIVMAEADGSMIGLLDYECGGRRRIRHSGTFSITVRPDFRGEGVGSALIQTLIDWGKVNSSVEKIGLNVFATNKRAIALYKKFGFVEEGRRVR